MSYPYRSLLLVPSLVFLALGMPSWVSAADPVASSSEPAVDTTSISAEQLLRRLPASPAITVKDDQVWWSDAQGASVAFAAVDPGAGNPLLVTAIGPLAIDRRLVAEGRTEAIAILGQLVAAAQAGNLKAEGLTLREGVLTGIHLRSETRIVLPEGVLTRADLTPPDRAAERDVVNQAAVAARGLLASGDTHLDEHGRAAVDDVISRTPSPDAKLELDEVKQSYARMLIRHGWADEFLPASGAGALKSAIAVAGGFQPQALFEGPGLRLAEVKDAFGTGGWVLTTPTRTRYVRPHLEPLYLFEPPRLHLVVDLPAGSDPLATTADPTGAKLYNGNQLIASWALGAGVVTDAKAWRQLFDHQAGGKANHAAAGAFPPHLVLTRMDGDIIGLATTRGLLKAPTTAADAAESERFLRDAAELLRGDEAQGISDAAVLDLLGQYLLTYVYDSPDSRYPHLIGNRQNKGDIHQTAVQTIQTSTGGMMRGDCDDLSELYQAIAERQGRTAIVIALPAHAACAWAERQRDQQWHVFVLQTGPALEFAAEKLPDALEAAYLSFDPNQPFDANGLGLLLRFSGENTRGSWRLSWRIFAEPDYCRTMIDVQRDWQYQTYQRGIHKMLKMIEAGDDDTANYRELSGLYSFTGQFDLAAEYHRKALDRTTDPVGKVLMQAELIGHLFEAKKTTEARALAEDLIAKQLPSVAKALGGRLAQTGLELAAILNRHEANDLAIRALATTALEPSGATVEGLARYLADPRFDESRWDNDPKIQSGRHTAQFFAAVALGLIDEAGVAALTDNEDLRRCAAIVQVWLDRIGFHDVDERDEAALRYALVARWYQALLGKDRFVAMLEASAMPTSAEHDHAQRIGGLAQLSLDLPWIRASVPYWFGQLSELFAKDHKTLDRPRFDLLAGRLAEAEKASKALGPEHLQVEDDLHFAALVTALIRQDETLLRARLRWVKDKDDKRVRDDTAQWIGDTARFLPIDWFTKVMVIWREELDYKPKWFWIAWRAHLGGAEQHALVAAKMAADRYPEDPSFAEEYDFMRRLIEPGAK